MSGKFEVMLVAAVAANNAIGKNGVLPWLIPEEFKHFKAITQGRVCIAGANTARSIGKALTGRPCFVVADKERGFADLVEDGWTVFSTFEEALENAAVFALRNGSRPVNHSALPVICVIGGEPIYKAALPRADYIWLSHVDVTVSDATAFFPEFNQFDYIQYRDQSHQAVYTGADLQTPAWSPTLYFKRTSEMAKVLGLKDDPSPHKFLEQFGQGVKKNAFFPANLMDTAHHTPPTPEDEARLTATLDKIFGKEGATPVEQATPKQVSKPEWILSCDASFVNGSMAFQHGVNAGVTLEEFVEAGADNFSFRRREGLERNIGQRHVITYDTIFQYNEAGTGLEVVVYERTKHSGEQTLANGRSIGIGGHVEKADAVHTDSDQNFPDILATIKEGVIRERLEELKLFSREGLSISEAAKRTILSDTKFIGFICDNEDPKRTGDYHLGLLSAVVLPKGIRAETRGKSDRFIATMPLEQALEEPTLERWSVMAAKYIIENNVLAEISK